MSYNPPCIKALSQKISEYRSEIMGFSIIWIFLFHGQYGNIFSVEIPILKTFLDYGYGGVDFFIFLSGFGLYHSFSKDSNLKRFYIRRFKRILPIYILVVILLLTVFNAHTHSFSSVVFWWLLLKRFWFLPCIILFYLIYPFLHKHLFDFVWLLSCFSFFYLLYLFLFRDSMVRFIVLRLPIFWVGMCVGKIHVFGSSYSLWSHKSLPIRFFLLGVVLLILDDLLIEHVEHISLLGINHIAFIFITPFACYLIAILSEMLNSYSYPIKEVGIYSLEIYLGHGIARIIMKNVDMWDAMTYFLLSILCSVFLVLTNNVLSRVFCFKSK